MPIYPYRCENCGFQKDALQKLSDPPLRDCPECGQARLARQLTAAGFSLKGSGWYVTDFRNSGQPSNPKAAQTAAPGAESAAATSSDSPAATPSSSGAATAANGAAAAATGAASSASGASGSATSSSVTPSASSGA
ncbi:MAG: zinc ribbon domain-containing protein [Burkholderiaceae bacterium]|nr:zinc ribbon domain-containing protein [Burkholderiaceae bacterium]